MRAGTADSSKVRRCWSPFANDHEFGEFPQILHGLGLDGVDGVERLQRAESDAALEALDTVDAVESRSVEYLRELAEFVVVRER